MTKGFKARRSPFTCGFANGCQFVLVTFGFIRGCCDFCNVMIINFWSIRNRTVAIKRRLLLKPDLLWSYYICFHYLLYTPFQSHFHFTSISPCNKIISLQLSLPYIYIYILIHNITWPSLTLLHKKNQNKKKKKKKQHCLSTFWIVNKSWTHLHLLSY